MHLLAIVKHLYQDARYNDKDYRTVSDYLHAAEPTLRSYQSLTLSRNVPPFMEPEC
jgi:hypothetical protein